MNLTRKLYFLGCCCLCFLERLFCGVPVVVRLASRELRKYNLTGWLPTFVSDAGSNVRRALAGRITEQTLREGDNLAEWARCACHMLHNVVHHALKHMEFRSHTMEGPKTLLEALNR